MTPAHQSPAARRRAELMSVRTGKPHAPGRKPKARPAQPPRQPRFFDPAPCATSGAVLQPPPPAGEVSDTLLADIIKRDDTLSLNRLRATKEVYQRRQDETVRVLEQYLAWEGGS